MALTLDSSITRIVTKSGTEITKVIRKSDGAVLWPLSTPYYVDIPSNPLTDTTNPTNHEYTVTIRDGYYYLCAKKNPDANHIGVAEGTVSLPTQGCNKVSINYTYVNASEVKINDQVIGGGTYNTNVNGTITFDCSGDTFTLILRVLESTEYYTAGLQITEIHFY